MVPPGWHLPVLPSGGLFGVCPQPGLALEAAGVAPSLYPLPFPPQSPLVCVPKVNACKAAAGQRLRSSRLCPEPSTCSGWSITPSFHRAATREAGF